MADVLGPLAGAGVSVHSPTPGTAVLGDAPLLRFAFASLVRQCEADALEKGQIPEVSVRVDVEGDAVHVVVTGGGHASLTSAPQVGPDLADAELSVVNAIVALHGGVLEAGSPERLPFPKGALRPDSPVFSPDGKRFLVERFDSEAFVEPIRLIRGWRRVVEK